MCQHKKNWNKSEKTSCEKKDNRYKRSSKIRKVKEQDSEESDTDSEELCWVREVSLQRTAHRAVKITATDQKIESSSTMAKVIICIGVNRTLLYEEVWKRLCGSDNKRNP